jgi:NAD(P)-dependent dehydrogenase (short-subunit alcohol dehydrogenase family)
VLAGRNADRLATAAATVAASGGLVQTVVCDVSDEDAVTAACAMTADLGRFTMCLANAGFGGAGPFHLTTADVWHRVLGTNLTGVFFTMKHAAPYMVRAGGGSIVAVSSIAGHLTHRFMTPYAVSKAGVEMLVKQVADELGGSGVRANAIRPGLVPTDATVGLTSTDVLLNDYLDQMPLGRVGEDDEVASLVRFLLGPESAWITGQCIGVDGGHSLRRGPNLTPVMNAVYGDTVQPS